MCGIAGFLAKDGLATRDIDAVRSMTRALIHRGPDDEGMYVDQNVALGTRRLSIIDLEGAPQPLTNEDGGLVLVANGEIYNYVELRAQLEARGHLFKTRGDCETILHLYEEHGVNCVDYLRGMFAFALWDAHERRLLLARDRMGEKPLYLFSRSDGVLFASEMKALLSSGEVPFELDPESVDLYFHYDYVPEPRTVLKNVQKLDAAHVQVIDVDSWQATTNRYWDMEDAPRLSGEPADLIREQLEAVSELVVRSDVPVGVALSGGLDSSVVATLAARRQPNLQAFSIGYPGRPDEDERNAARALARHLGLDFHEIEVSSRSVVDGFPNLVFWQDDPIADIAGYGYYAVMRFAREHGVPVVLQGHGGDELFWGYGWARNALRESMRKKSLVERGWLAWVDYIRLQGVRNPSPRGVGQWLRSLAGARPGLGALQRDLCSDPDRLIFYDVRAHYRRARTLYSPQFEQEVRAAMPESVFTVRQPWPRLDLRITSLSCATYLRQIGIAQTDRLSMASSVELRLPLVDHRFVETVIGLKKNEPDHDLDPKARLRGAVNDLLPAEVMNRPKRGFVPPAREWLVGIVDAYGEALPGGYLQSEGIVRHDIGKIIERERWREDSSVRAIYKLLILEFWCRGMMASCGNA